MDYTIIGGEVNLASRLQSHAELGGILLSHETYSLVQDAVLAEECSPIQAKGFSRPIRNYRVVDPLGEREPEARLIHEEREGLRIVADLQKLDRASAVEALRALIARLGG